MYVTANYASEFLFHNLYFLNLNNSNLFLQCKGTNLFHTCNTFWK